MECGHANNGTLYSPNGVSKPMCMMCGCDKIKKEITDVKEGLKNRTALCVGHKGGADYAPTPSRWNLPFFQYTPQYKYDEYYCGCWGWE